MAKGILIWLEVTKDYYLHTVGFELANKSLELSQKLGNAPVMGLVVGKTGLIENFHEALQNSGFDKVFYVEDERLSEYSTDFYKKSAVEAIKVADPEILLIGATNQGRDIAPRISTSLHTGLTADCTGLDINEQGKLAATRPTFGGQLMATILSKTIPQMATVRPKVFKPSESDVKKNTEFIKVDVNFDDIEKRVEIIEFKNRIKNSLNDLDSAEIIVAGGKGMKNLDGFKLIKALADKLGASVGASRVAVEMGLADSNMQVGQTGKTVNPKLYIACGISGAVQHVVGMKGSSKIMAINNDPKAPIFEISDSGIVGDAFEIIPQLIKKL